MLLTLIILAVIFLSQPTEMGLRVITPRPLHAMPSQFIIFQAFNATQTKLRVLISSLNKVRKNFTHKYTLIKQCNHHSHVQIVMLILLQQNDAQ